MLPPDAIESWKQSADYRLTVQVESLDRTRAGTGGRLDEACAEGRIMAVTRAPDGVGAQDLRPGERIAFSVDAWPWHSNDDEPPGPARLYWGPGAPLPLLEVWGIIRGAKFVALVFETTGTAPGSVAPQSVAEVLDLIERVAATVADPPPDMLAASIEELTGLRFEATREESPRGSRPLPLRATGEGWARGAELRETAAGPLLVLTLGDEPCVRSSDVIATHGVDGRPFPAPPGQALPSTWELAYSRPWGRITYGFRFARAGDFDDCLVKVTVSRDGGS